MAAQLPTLLTSTAQRPRGGKASRAPQGDLEGGRDSLPLLAVQANRGARFRDLGKGGRDERPPRSLEAPLPEAPAFHDTGDECRLAIGRFFGSQYNPSFADSAELAMRAAFFVVVVGLPFLIPKAELPTLDFYMQKGVYTSSVAIFFVYNLAKTTGETTMTVICGLRGTFLAVANAWLMYLAFPDGVTESTPGYVFWVAVLEGLAFLVLMLFLNWEENTVIFAVSTWVPFWMEFLKPGEANFACPFTEKFTFLGDAGINNLITVAVGGLLCIMVTFLPYPRWSLSKARRTARELIHHLPFMWKTMAEYYCEDRPSSYKADQIYRQLQRLSQLATTLNGDIGHSWYECFFQSNSNHVRRNIAALEQVINENYDRIFSTYSVTQAAEWGPLHEDLAKRIRPAMVATARATEQLLAVCFRCSFDGELAEEEEDEIHEAVAAARRCENEFTKAFGIAREAVLEHRGDARRNEQCMEELLPDHALALHFSSFVRTVTSFAEETIHSCHDPDHFPPVTEIPGISSLWDWSVLSDPAHFNWSLRASCAMFAGLLVGYFGFRDIFSPYDANIAVTVSALLSKFSGSAIVQNFGRIQGLVLGSIVGEVVHSVFDDCEASSVVSLAACLFIYAAGSLLVFYNSTPQFQYMGSRLAAFGCMKMLVGGCGASRTHDSERIAGYGDITVCVFATALVVLFDFVFPPGRASTLAHESLTDAIDLLEEALAQNFDRLVGTVRFHKGELHAAIARAEAMGEEAVAEPRYWRTAWRADVFNAAVRAAYKTRYSLAAMEYGMVEEPGAIARDHVASAGLRKSAVMRSILAAPACGRLLEVVSRKVRSVVPLADIFVHETCDRFPALSDPSAEHDLRGEIDKARSVLVRELARHPLMTRGAAARGGTLESDPLCQVCVVLGSVESMVESLREFQHAILRTG